ncbi:MAG: 1,4-alpha-glucan branching protein GlgB [Ignavibacteriales bacterium]|nr:1,4-alpha-glucan branching protein GlgB [Ignavibacteriales bacterium]
MKSTVSQDEMHRIVSTDHYDPFQVLGPHVIQGTKRKSLAIRAFLPDTNYISVVELKNGEPAKEYPMQKILDEGFFEVVIPNRSKVFPYKLKRVIDANTSDLFYDSYSFLPTLTDFDLYLFNAGDHHRIYEKLGAHYAEVNGVGGIQFAVWAPAARSVSVIGSFNGWDRRKHAMRVLGSSGVWEIFIPGLPEGELYKFQVKTQPGEILDKTDPYAVEMELRPSTASRVNLLSGFSWSDNDWMKRRASDDHGSKPMSVYEVHLGSWARIPEEGNRWLTYREFAERLVAYVKQHGFTHIELLPVMEHPLDGSWGYQVTGYFAPTSRFGKPQDFMHFVDHCHQNRIGVILDWVPAHFPKDIHALGEFDGTHLYEHADPRKGEHQDWGTYIFNFGRKEVKNFLISNALYWIDKYHIDGFRIDAVASMLYLDYSRKEGEWLPNQYGGRENLDAIEFIKYLNSIVHQYYPGVLTIAEESTAWPGVTNSLEHGGLGFDLKWNMGWMHDMLEYFSKDPIHRSHHHRNLTFVLLYAFTERFLLPLSHDEVVHGKRSLLDKMPGDVWQKFANLRALHGLQYGFPGKKLLFMGDEIGQWTEWSHDQSLDWHLLNDGMHSGLLRWIDDLNKFYKHEPALYEIDFHYTGFDWIDFHDSVSSIISFERKSVNAAERIIVVCNFTPVPRLDYRIGVAEQGAYAELLNSDSSYYGGSNMGNAGTIESEEIPHHNRQYSIRLTLPPLAILFLKLKS